MKRLANGLFLAREPLASVPLAFGASSITSLLLYFFGVTEMGAAVRALVLVGLPLFALFHVWAFRAGHSGLVDRVLSGLWAGLIATFAYDLVRVPIAISGVPVFKAISYFGTVILGEPTPSPFTEIAGWSYHLSNGVGFGLMYAVLFTRPRAWTAITWGLVLELTMLLTPYAEVFGYRVSPRFLTITIGSHVVYGVALWIALRYWSGERFHWIGWRRSVRGLILIALVALLGIAVIAGDFYSRFARTIPPSPPPYIGRLLYTSWNVLEVDRLAVLWTWTRFVEPDARLHLVEPFTQSRHGVPLDTPESAVRRSATRAAMEILLEQQGLDADPKLRRLAAVAHLHEINPWMRPLDPEAAQLGRELMALTRDCGQEEVEQCLQKGFAFLDRWYESG